MDTDNIYAFLGALFFHFIIILILGFTVLRSVVPEEEEGVLVNFGNVDAASGTFEPRYTGGEPPRQTTPPPSLPPVQENLITQDTEESIALAEEKKREALRREEERRRADEQRRQREAIDSRVAGAFGMGGSSETDSQGDADNGAGNQGSPFGNSDRGQNEGVGGMGSFNLNGRSLRGGGLPLPAYTVQEEGRIVINITVDPKGNVIFTEIGKGTNLDNASMRQSALRAAGNAKFNTINGANNQSGTITYNYRLIQ